MKLEWVQQVSREYMDKFGLTEWSFEWSRKKRSLATCSSYRQTIYISKYYALLNDETDLRDTILHEVAHALVGAGHGHDAVWKAKCIEIGANPTRFASENVVMPVGRIVYECHNCGKQSRHHRRLRRTFACRRCCTEHNSGKFDPRFTMVLKHTGRGYEYHSH